MLLLNLLVVSLHLPSILLLASQVKLCCCLCVIVLLLALLFILHLVQNLHLETNMCSANIASRSVFFNQGSASGCQGFHQNGPKLAGLKFTSTVLCGCTNTTVSKVYYSTQDRHLDHCIGFHEQRKHLRKASLQQKGSKTLVLMAIISVVSISNPLLIYIYIQGKVSYTKECNKEAM